MKTQLNKIACIAGLAIAAALPALAQPYYIAGDNITPNWTTIEPGATPMSGGPTVYSISLATATAGAYHQVKAAASNWVSSWPNNNMLLKSDANGSNTFYFFPGTIADGWYPIANRVGYADPGNMSWGIIGAFNGWSTDVPLNSIGNGVYSNSITVATAGTYGFKFRTPGVWNEVRFGVDFGNDNSDGSFTTTNSPQTVPVRLDLPNGRYVIGDLAPPPVTNQVVFAVDMSVELYRGTFDPATDRVCVSGAFNGWPGTGPTALTLTNVPTWPTGNTNIYYGTATVIGAPSSFGSDYKFTDTNPNTPFGYESRSQNRSFSLLATSGTNQLPVVYWSDATTNDYTAVDTLVTFSLNMAGRSSVSNVLFDPSIHSPPFINGNFLTNSWVGTWNPITLAPYAMTESPSGSTNYVFSYMVPKGHLVRVQYKYGFDDSLSFDNEAPSGQDHVRYIRSTGTGAYSMPNDTFGIQYNEPSFGELAIGTPTGGNTPISWLGRPGVKLQSASTLTGAWTDHNQTDGTNWTIGASSTNGFKSSTNWPSSSGTRFFRLIKQ
ncbi:MAG: hypothetical protein RLY20_3396 [Verrucomicrobiota bacterium]|jgi:hypothetical protein